MFCCYGRSNWVIWLLATLIAQMNGELMFVQPRPLEDSKLGIPQHGILLRTGRNNLAFYVRALSRRIYQAGYFSE
jgi:hypothetical protein